MSFFQAQIPPLPADISLRGQTIIVTGATGGIGYEASLQLLRLGAANLILAVRNLQKGSAARLSLLADEQVRATNPSATVKVVDLDLSDYQSVSAFASRVLKTEDRLDVLLLNAGINLAHFSRSVSGHEMYATIYHCIFLPSGCLLLTSRPHNSRADKDFARKPGACKLTFSPTPCCLFYSSHSS